MLSDTLLYEELAMNAHPAMATQLYDGWVLRFSSGYTFRANSVNPLYPSSLPVAEKLAFCEAMYAREGLPAVFKLTDASPEGLDETLAAAGYALHMPTYLFTCSHLPKGGAEDKVRVIEGIDPGWRADFFRLDEMLDRRRRETASAMMDNVRGAALCRVVWATGFP